MAQPPEAPEPTYILREFESLDRLAVKVVRIVAGSEGPNSEPIRMKASLHYAPGAYSMGLLQGLDFLFKVMDQLGMRKPFDPRP